MIEIKVTRGPGRPRVRPDRETRQAIYEAARYEFAGSGYAGRRRIEPVLHAREHDLDG
jgi:hypothetical protein